jgi:hypothetical protein
MIWVLHFSYSLKFELFSCKSSSNLIHCVQSSNGSSIKTSMSYVTTVVQAVVFLTVLINFCLSQNIVTNPGGETNILAPWTSAGDYTTGWAIGSTDPKTGTKYFATTCTFVNCVPLVQTLTVHVGSTYSVSFWAYSVSASGTMTVTFEAQVFQAALTTSYQLFTTNFVAAVASVDLTFFGNNLWVRLDDVVVSNIDPSTAPTRAPSVGPSTIPTLVPSWSPTAIPSKIPSQSPSIAPSANPSVIPSLTPSCSPTVVPSKIPSNYLAFDGTDCGTNSISFG